MNYKETLFFIGKCLTINHEEHNRVLVEKELINNAVDWDAVVKVSTGHFVFPALYCNLKRANFLQYLPSDLVEYMKHITDLNRDRNQQILDQAKELNELLLANNITPIFLKGTGNLLEGLYEDIAERMVGDIDFLVSADKFEKTVNILLDNNHEKTSKKISSPLFEKHFPRLYNKNKISAVEVHNNVLKKPGSNIFNFETIKLSLLKKKKYTFLSYLDQLSLSILAFQFNDNGYFYKSVGLRNSYDVYLLSFKTNELESIAKYKKLSKYLNSYLFISKSILNSKKIKFIQKSYNIYYINFFLLKLNSSLMSNLHRIFCDIIIYMRIKSKGLLRFLNNKEFRLYYIKKLTS